MFIHHKGGEQLSLTIILIVRKDGIPTPRPLMTNYISNLVILLGFGKQLPNERSLICVYTKTTNLHRHPWKGFYLSHYSSAIPKSFWLADNLKQILQCYSVWIWDQRPCIDQWLQSHYDFWILWNNLIF